MPFITLSCLIVMASISRTVLNRSGETRYPHLIPDVKGKALSISPLRMMLAVNVSLMLFTRLKKFPSSPCLLSALIRKG